MVAAFSRAIGRNRRGIIRASVVLVLSWCALSNWAAPATQPGQAIQGWFTQLADPSGATREKALENLMSLQTADLATLRNVVAAAVPLKPSQRAVLRDIVEQVYKSGIEYDNTSKGFLGVGWNPLETNLETGAQRGVIITFREQGFPAYRLLRDGDIVKQIEQFPMVPFDDTDQFKMLIQTFKPGDIIKLVIEREGQILHIALETRPRPSDIDTSERLSAWRSKIQEQTDAFWDQNFAKLVDASGM